VSRYTPASSLVSKPTNRLGSSFFGSERNSSPSPTGSIFAAQPQVFDRLWSVGVLEENNAIRHFRQLLTCRQQEMNPGRIPFASSPRSPRLQW
jgi:hypothetical protein